MASANDMTTAVVEDVETQEGLDGDTGNDVELGIEDALDERVTFGEGSDRSISEEEEASEEDDFDIAEFEKGAEEIAREAEEAERKMTSAAEKERQAEEARRLREERKEKRAQREAFDAELSRLAPGVAALARVITTSADEKAKKARTRLAVVGERLVKLFPNAFDGIVEEKKAEEGVRRALLFVAREGLLRQIAKTGNRRRDMAELLASDAFRAEGIIPVTQEEWEAIERWNEIILDARWKRDHGKRFDPRAAKGQRAKLLSFTYRVDGKEEIAAFAGGRPFAFKALVQTDNLMHEDARRQHEFFKCWEEQVLSELGETVSVTDLMTKSEITEGTAAFTMFFTPEKGSEECQLVGLVLTRDGSRVALETVLHEHRPGVPDWFNDLVPEDSEPNWYDIGVDSEDPNLFDLPRLLARAVRMQMGKEGFKFPDRAKRGRRQELKPELFNSLFGGGKRR